MISKIKKIFNVGRLLRDISLNNKLKKIRWEVIELTKDQVVPTQRVLFGMSFSIYGPSRVHDFLLSQALILRGAEIIPVICGALQEGECVVWGGVWGGYTGNIRHDTLQSKKNCKRCMRTDNLLWNDWAGIKPICLSNYITTSEKNAIKSLASSYDISNYKEWIYEDMPVGRWALDVLRNNALTVDETLIENYKNILKSYLYNILLVTESCKKMLDETSPNIIIANDSYYYMWAILERLAEKKSIPFYSQWCGGRRGGWCYAKGEPSMAINLSEPWKVWKHRVLSDHENQVLDEFLRNRRSGKAMILNTAKPRRNGDSLDNILKSIDFNKPTALLATNLIWDLAALNKEIQFTGMVDWVYKVIDFFEINPQFQLLIKAHPAEKHRAIPQTRQLVGDEIKKYRKLPKNVFFIDPESSISFYDLTTHIKVGLVFTSTVGLEMACEGIPVITSGKSPYYGKGFTYDPLNSREYFEFLKKLLELGDNPIERETRIKLARKFFYLYYFRYYTSLNLFDYSFADEPTLNISSAKDLMPGENKVLDYVCDSILNHFPIVSKDRWPPEPDGSK